ncbi:hypothetical protein JW777_00740 [bacterium]|nr:hypothetical protein [bacterium]
MTRAEQYRDEMDRLVERLGFREAYDVFRARLFDQASRGLLTGENIREIVRQIEPLFEPAAAHQLREIEKQYDDTLTVVNGLYRDLTSVDATRDLSRVATIERTNRTRWGRYSRETVGFISKQVRESLSKNETSKQLAARFEQSVDGKVVKFADTLARTIVKGHGQECKNEKARLGGVDFFTYVGPPVVTTGIPSTLSHRLCIELYRSRKRTFSAGDIDQMINGQIKPVRAFKGGYRCRHDWEPDPFYSGKDYKVTMITVMDGKREVTFGRHV